MSNSNPEGHANHIVINYNFTYHELNAFLNVPPYIFALHYPIPARHLEDSASTPFWTRIRYWIRGIRESGSGSCKTRPADSGPDLDPVPDLTRCHPYSLENK